MTARTGQQTSVASARKAWIDERVERFAAGLCSSLWHDEGHSWHSSCNQCDRKFMRGYEIKLERERLEGFAKAAERYTRDIGLCSEVRQ